MTVRDKKADLEALSSRLSALPPLPRDDGGPVFAEPWQAQAFALAVRLSEQTMSARKEEWADAYRHTPHGKPVELHRHDHPAGQ